MNRFLLFAAGTAASLAATALWHGPLGAGERLAVKAEREARIQLDHDEMTHVRAQIERQPLTRRIILTGPADTFQREEIARRMEELPGVGTAQWAGSGTMIPPLLGEAEAGTLVAFAIGLLLGYLVEVRRRNRPW